jgi:threonine dehydrogenase-like Zn-dependent dehydrogenase
MKRMVFVEPGRLAWEEVPDPLLQGPLEAIVRPLCMGRCDLDRLYLSGRAPLASGEPIGHEIFGEIVDLGEAAAAHFRIGQRVIVPAQISCGDCAQCRRGQTGRCERVPLGASYGMGRAGAFGGGVADLVRVPFARGMLVPLAATEDPVRLMGLADMATDAWRAVGPQLARRPGGTVLIVNGMVPVIGVYAAALAVCLGAGRVVYVDADAARRAAAADYGAEVAETVEAAGASGFDIVVDAAGDAGLLLEAVRACGPAASLTSVAPPFASPTLPLGEMYYKGLTWEIGRPNCRHGHDPALHAWAAKGFDPSRIGPKRFRYEDAIEAWLDPALYVAVERSWTTGAAP